MADQYYIDNGYFYPEDYFGYVAQADSNLQINAGGSRSGIVNYVSGSTVNIVFGTTINGVFNNQAVCPVIFNSSIDGDVIVSGSLSANVQFNQLTQSRLFPGNGIDSTIEFTSTATPKYTFSGESWNYVNFGTSISARVGSRARLDTAFTCSSQAALIRGIDANLTSSFNLTAQQAIDYSSSAVLQIVFSLNGDITEEDFKYRLVIPGETNAIKVSPENRIRNVASEKGIANILPETRLDKVASESRTLVM